MQEHAESTTSGGKRSLLDGWNSPPNLVTYTRILLVIVFIVLDVMAGDWGHDNMGLRWTAAILFIIAASTDKLDGWMARRYNQVTELGKLMDPIADKLLICSALIVASLHHEVRWWITVLFLIREIGITLLRVMVINKRGMVIAASRAGKYKTLLQCFGLGMLMVPLGSYWSGYLPLTQAVIILALVLCLYSGGEYLVGVYGVGSKATSSRS
ncbi:CDP-diacylglycerol--glycerol-3-phosphate 3-phosphatidyltransferase [uncultured Bifidobacterium sp.]|uniref:CDP-diacylglycerol--glycerol-3-phosphate 3-phosphatidyltransferase n=1 Tax=uncultured Bifidobacterium sp. TaxID=165187 RepID=UPI002631CF1F|nr:CDP-diacylglycerol--glycerol-3-phosphate 3-phosphatidyltransferase [uncultured Bifidobacterium sp.]